MRDAKRGVFGGGLALAATVLGAPFVYLGNVTLAGRAAPYAGPQVRAIGQPEPPPPPPGQWPHVEALPTVAVGFSLAVAGSLTGRTAFRTGVGKAAAVGGPVVALVILGALGVDFAREFVRPAPM